MRRALALVVAVALVAGAWYLRSNVLDKDDGKASSGTGKGAGGGGDPVVGCATGLDPVCNVLSGLDVKVAAPVDVSEAAAPAARPDLWLTYGSGPGMVAAAAGQPVFGAGTVIARDRIGLVTFADRAALLRTTCNAPRFTWGCLVQFAGGDWPPGPGTATPSFPGTVKVGAGRPETTLGSVLAGPLALAAPAGGAPPAPGATTTTIATAEVGIGDIDTDAVRRVLASADRLDPADQLQRISTQGPGAYSFVVAPGAAAQRIAGTSQARGKGLVVLYPEPVASTVVVLSARVGVEVPDAVLEVVRGDDGRRALADAGWTPADKGSSSGLPAADVLYALRGKLR